MVVLVGEAGKIAEKDYSGGGPSERSGGIVGDREVGRQGD